MQESLVKFLSENGGMTQIDWRIPLEGEQAWREGILRFKEPQYLLQYVLAMFKERKRTGTLPKFDFPKVKGGDSRKRVRVYCSDYWEVLEYASGFDVAPSRFLSAILRWEWVLSSGFKQLDFTETEGGDRTSNDTVKDFPVFRGSLLERSA